MILSEHRFMDEAGDTTFFGKGRVVTIGKEGVSLAFSLGMVKFNVDPAPIRQELIALQMAVEKDDYVNRIPSVAKKISRGGFFFHATDDPPEVRERLYRFIKSIDCSLEMVVGRKIPLLFARKHNSQESEFYADLLSHLLKNKLQMDRKLVLTIAQRGTSTRNENLGSALDKAVDRFARKFGHSEIACKVAFNVQNPRTEPLLNIADYMSWAVQRVFERGEMRHYEFIQEKISLVLDVYDLEKFVGSRNYYRKGNPLTAENKLSPPSP